MPLEDYSLVRQPPRVGNSCPHTRGAHSPPLQSGAAASARLARTQRSTTPPPWGQSPILFSAPLFPLASPIRFFSAPSVVWTSVPGPISPCGIQTVPGPGWPSPPSPQASPLVGRPSSDRPGQFWRISRGPGDWAWGGIYQLLSLTPDGSDLSVQRWLALPSGPGRPRFHRLGG